MCVCVFVCVYILLVGQNELVDRSEASVFVIDVCAQLLLLNDAGGGEGELCVCVCVYVCKYEGRGDFTICIYTSTYTHTHTHTPRSVHRHPDSGAALLCPRAVFLLPRRPLPLLFSVGGPCVCVCVCVCECRCGGE